MSVSYIPTESDIVTEAAHRASKWCRGCDASIGRRNSQLSLAHGRCNRSTKNADTRAAHYLGTVVSMASGPRRMQQHSELTMGWRSGNYAFFDGLQTTSGTENLPI